MTKLHEHPYMMVIAENDYLKYEVSLVGCFTCHHFLNSMKFFWPNDFVQVHQRFASNY
jgi:hypothetical protein